MIIEKEYEVIEEFQKILKKDEYITSKEYNEFLDKNHKIFLEAKDEYLKEIINNGYEQVERHNEEYINKKLVEEKEYFDNMFKDIDDSIVLDIEQRKAILNDEDYSLIIAGAGARKTTTMAAKVKYLIERKKVNPENIAVLSYTNKATNEIEDRIKYEFNLPEVNIMTFHSFGLKIVRHQMEKTVIPVSEKERKDIIIEFIKKVLYPNKYLLDEYIKVFNKYIINGSKMFSKGFIENYNKFSTFEEYFNDYKKRKQEENKDNLQKTIEYKEELYLNLIPPRSLKNEIMRSKAEAKIANFLFKNGIEYKYEEPYPEKVDEYKSYLPDFTIEVNERPIFIEYFGLSQYYDGGTISKKNLLKYEDIRKKKREYHLLKNNNYIELDYKKEENNRKINYLEDLEKKLIMYGATFKKRTNEEIYNQILDNNTSAEFFHFVDFILEFIDNIKSNINREYYKEILEDYITHKELKLRKEMQKEVILLEYIFKYYEDCIIPLNKIDFSDMIYYANKYLLKNKELKKLDYEYLIIDEYQDISLERYHFAKNLSIVSNAKITSVGDDWQTIFSFAGSRIDLFYKYNELFPGAKQLFINNTYRNSQELIDISGNFIMKNPYQIKKNLLSNKNREEPIKIIETDNEIETLLELIEKIYLKNKQDTIMILARKNKHINNLLNYKEFEKGEESRIIYHKYPNAKIYGMSIHSAKGLGAEQVIILNVNKNDFPCKDIESVWFLNLFKQKNNEENFEYAEERRIFYVALTRTKKDVYLLTNKNRYYQSPFIEELK